jgi:hypothetical protein
MNRWDLHVADVDTKDLVNAAAAPKINEPEYRVILAARRYVKMCCDRISHGNIMIRRQLMVAK